MVLKVILLIDVHVPTLSHEYIYAQRLVVLHTNTSRWHQG